MSCFALRQSSRSAGSPYLSMLPVTHLQQGSNNPHRSEEILKLRNALLQVRDTQEPVASCNALLWFKTRNVLLGYLPGCCISRYGTKVPQPWP